MHARPPATLRAPAAQTAPAAPTYTAEPAREARIRTVAEELDATYSHDGLAPTVTFVQTPASPVLARTMETAATTTATTTTTQPATAQAAQAAQAAVPDLDDLYEHVADRLRRELLLDRERSGDLVGDLLAHRTPR